MRQSPALITVFLATTSGACGAIWTESFDDGVGRLDQVQGLGGSLFQWNPSFKSIDGRFIRNGGHDSRYASLGAEYAAHESLLGFSTVVTPLSSNATETENTGARIGFFYSDPPSWDHLTVTFSEKRPNDGRVAINGVYADGTSFGGSSINGEYFAISFGTTYFVYALIDPVEDTFTIEVFEGTDSTGDYVGTLSVPLNPTRQLRINALGMFNTLDASGLEFDARVHQISLIPEPAALLLLALGGLAATRRSA